MRNYFVYLPDNGLCDAWRCTAISMGHTVIPPGSIYPPRRHPDDHHLDWRNGRILQAYQIVYISAGQGTFEYGPEHTRVAIQTGDIFVLFPGEWHRYEPDPTTGWTENWIECKSAAYDSLTEKGLLSPDRPVMHSNGHISDLFVRIHQLALEGGNRQSGAFVHAGAFASVVVGASSRGGVAQIRTNRRRGADVSA